MEKEIDLTRLRSAQHPNTAPMVQHITTQNFVSFLAALLPAFKIRRITRPRLAIRQKLAASENIHV